MLHTKQTGSTHRDVTEIIGMVFDAWQTERWNRPLEGSKHKDRNKIRRTGDIYCHQNGYLFTKSKRAFSAETQLFARSGQLTTQKRARERYMYTPHDHCLLCDTPVEQTDEHHVFIECPAGNSVRSQGRERCMKAVQSAFNKQGENVNIRAQRQHEHLSAALFKDDALWASGQSHYWRGELPRNFVEYRESLNDLYDDLSGIMIITTARIWGLHRREAARVRKNRAPNHSTARPPARQTQALTGSRLGNHRSGNGNRSDEPDSSDNEPDWLSSAQRPSMELPPDEFEEEYIPDEADLTYEDQDWTKERQDANTMTRDTGVNSG